MERPLPAAPVAVVDKGVGISKLGPIVKWERLTPQTASPASMPINSRGSKSKSSRQKFSAPMPQPLLAVAK
jgi:hypothetical protein